MAESKRRWTAGRTTLALHRLMRDMTADERRTDPLLADLKAARWIAYSLDDLVDRTITAARRRRQPYTWKQIGDALGVSGQAVGQRARARRLSVRRLTPDEYAELVAKGRAALGRQSR